MSDRLKNFDADRDRNDPRRAAQLFDLLWPTRDTKVACARRLAQSIRYAHKQGKDSWSISMFDQSINLNVGQVQVLQFRPDEIFVYARLARGKSVYNAVSIPCRRFRYLLDEVTSIPPQQWKNHEWFIDAAAEAKTISPFRRAFSKGIMLHLEKLLQTKLPLPGYLDSAAEESDSLLQSIDGFPTASEGRRSRDQGFGLSPLERDAVEMQAMTLAKAYLEELGWQVRDVSSTQPYDLECTRGSEELIVEVKGTTSAGEQIIVTRNEVAVQRARYPNNALIIVHSMSLARSSAEPKADGGELSMYCPWIIEEGRLSSLVFQYSVRPDDPA